MQATIVIPTKRGREALAERATQAALGQAWAGLVDVVLVADAGSRLRGRPWVRQPAVQLVEINDSWRDGVRDKSIGAVPWMVGSLIAQGDLIGFCGDDDELHPDHVHRHAEVLAESSVAFTISPVRFCVGGVERFVIGDASFAHGHLDADGIMCNRWALRTANWTATGEDAADWRLVQDWLRSGLVGQYIGGEPTATHNDGWAAR